MAEQRDLELFLSGVGAWNDGVAERKHSTFTEPDWRFKADLSETHIGNILWQRVGSEENFFVEQATHYPRADLSFCDLRGTTFTTMIAGFDFREAYFMHSNLQEANLAAADLRGARFMNADWGMRFSGVRLSTVRDLTTRI